jgi:hypothetical protein
MNLIEWTPNKGQFASGESGKRNGVELFSTHYDACRSKGSDVPPWQLTCKLPSIKPILGNFKTKEEANKKAEEVFNYWLTKLNLSVKV